MARPYRSIKYRYSDDFGTERLKFQRQYQNPETLTPLLPLTVKFMERVLDTPEKVVTNFNGENQRRFICYVKTEDNNTEFAVITQFVPFNQFEDIREQLKQTINLQKVECADYNGENSGYQQRINNG